MITLKNNHAAFVDATSYHKDGEQYVFPGKDPAEVQFFVASQVIGISVISDEIDPPGGTLVSIPF